MKKVSFYIIPLIAVLFFVSCSKDGEVGPEGNANVKTDVFSLTSADWLWNSSYSFKTSPSSSSSYYSRYYVRNNSSITQDVLDNGMVLVYFTPNSSNNDQWEPLPYQFTDFSLAFDYNIAFETVPGSVKLHYFFVRRNATATLPELSIYKITDYKFKIVAVGGNLGTFMLAQKVDLKNYNEVSKAMELWQQNKKE